MSPTNSSCNTASTTATERESFFTIPASLSSSTTSSNASFVRVPTATAEPDNDHPLTRSSPSRSSPPRTPNRHRHHQHHHHQKRVTMSPTVDEQLVASLGSPSKEYDNASSTKTPSETDMEEVDVEMGKTTPTKEPSSEAFVGEMDSTDKARLSTGTTDLPRLVLRNRPFHQSSNKVHIQHNQGARIYSLLKHNWFHVFLRWPTSRSLPFLLSVWTAAILVFAGIYMWYDRLDNNISCGLGLEGMPMTFAAAFAFSLETCTTVGYGLPHGINSYFEEGCSSLQIIIYFQMAWSMIFNAFLITFLYNRIGRSESRGAQVICSNKALVSEVDGQVRFQVRLFDADAKHPVVEAHVRFYAVMKHRPVPRPLRLLQPDDELGGMLFLSFPTVVNHHIDLYSLLHPPSTTTVDPQGLVLREVDGTTAGRDDIICPICGESYGTLERFKNHVRYQQIVEAKDDYPVAGTHLSLDLREIEKQLEAKATNNLNELREFFKNNVSEVICVVEGIDPMQSGTFQALQSYRYEDIKWEKHSHFAPCMTVVDNKRKGRIFQVDLDRYHDVVPDEEAIAAARREEEAAAAAAAAKDQPKKRHRRTKTVSRKQSDMIFMEATA